MNKHSGEDLLQIFKKLNIEIGNLHPSVINAWFDTDCPKTANILNFLCDNLSEDNLLSAQEENEYNQLENVLDGPKLESGIEIIDKKYPEIFDNDASLFEIEVAQEEIEIVEKQLQDYDHQIEINKQLETKLKEKSLKISEEEIRIKVKKQETEEKCLKISSELDQLCKELHETLIKYQHHLYNFQFSNNPQFINNYNISAIEEKFLEILPFLTSSTNNDSIAELNTSESFATTLAELQNRIFQSHLKLLAQKMEFDQLENLYDFLNHYKTDLLPIHCEQLELKLETERSQKSLMLNILENTILQISEFQVSQPRLRCVQNTLQICKTKLEHFNKLDDGLVNILSHFFLLHNLYFQEKLDFKNSSKFFSNVVHFINQDMKNCEFRSKGMSDVIEDFKHFSSSPIEKQYNLIQECGKIVTGTDNSSFTEILEAASKLRIDIKHLEKNIFIESVHRHFKSSRNLSKSVSVLEKFLRSGPTKKILTIPLNFRMTCLAVNGNFMKQSEAVKQAVQIMKNAKDKFVSDKKLIWLSQLWQYFLENPAKMMSLLDAIENKSLKVIF